MMIDDLFARDEEFTRVDMPDADVAFLERFPLPLPERAVARRLHQETIWQHEKVHVYGKWHLQPRLTAWFGDPGKKYTYSSTVMNPLPWTDLLLTLRRDIEMLVGATFNSVLLNLYRDHNDRMGFHSDNEASLGDEPTIASLSLGATRTLIFKHKRNKTEPLHRIQLTSSSVLVMRGVTQANWNHGINRQAKPCGPRINLTFRNIVK
jgi:alkylated DNA repair dioxygenase AlkB